MRKYLLIIYVLLNVLLYAGTVRADDGYRLWLKYDLISNPKKLSEYRQSVKGWIIEGSSPTIEAARHRAANWSGWIVGLKDS